MPQNKRPVLKIIITFCLVTCLSTPLAANDWNWETDARVIALSDIHGAHEDYVGLLKGLKLINDDGSWTGGKDHLVIVGDILDRGAGSRAALELTMRLESEAEQVGGKVHMLLGNHEIMNLVGDLRYVDVAEYAAYVDVEEPQDRKAALNRFMRIRQGGEVNESDLEMQFAKQHPPGFFGHQKLFSEKGVFGSWLLKRPVSVKVNDSVFVHGGLSPAVGGQSLEKINRTHQQIIGEYMSSREYFIDKGFLEQGTNFYDQPSTLNQVMSEEKNRSMANKKKAKMLIDAYNSSIFADSAPTWYRGNVGCSEAIEKMRLRKLLSSFGANRLVVGHTPTATRTIENRFDELLIRVDTGMLKSRYRGQASAVIIESDKISTYYLDSDTTIASTLQPRRVGPGPAGLSDDMLEEVFANAALTSTEILKDGRNRMTLNYQDTSLEAIFRESKSRKKKAVNIPAVASYRLDKLLGLEMVPVTVSREFEGNAGRLSVNLERLMDEEQRTARQIGSAWCPLKDQFNMMYVFDLLLHNKGRQQTAMRYSAGEMRLVLVDNDGVLGTQSGAPRYLKSVPMTLNEDLRSRLQVMDEEQLENLLGDVLDEKRRKAILKRRDLLIKKAE
ncbi:MAG: hypothetical protein GKR93_11735 [Gammaproteobacteria bacterium]|nr:hypothetical protein [Gammaproteobacteria bacterium]